MDEMTMVKLICERVMGWQVGDYLFRYQNISPLLDRTADVRDGESGWRSFAPLDDLNAAHEMEVALDRDGKGLLYAAALLDVMGIGENPRFPMRCLFGLVHATASQRATAACRVVEQETGK